MDDQQSCRVLIVDDNPIHRTLLREFFLTKGFTVDEAASGNDAIRAVGTNRYTVILMDQLMPGMSGSDTVKRIRETGVNTPVIAQSSLSMKQDRERSLDAGCDAFVSKPIDFKTLWSVVEDLIDLHGDGTDETMAEVQVSSPSSGPGSRLSGRKAVLVEEDDEKAVHNLKILRRMGLEVTRQRTGSDALEYIDGNTGICDIVVANIYTSGIDGLGMMTMLKRRQPSIRVFLYMSEFDSEMLQTAVRLGADGVVAESALDASLENIIETSLSTSGESFPQHVDIETAKQVRKSQERLYRYGLIDECPYIDVTTVSLHDAGGDIVLCRQFNKAGRFGIVLADVSGHDVMSSYISAIFLGILASLWDTVQEPDALLEAINDELLKLDAREYHICMTALLWDRPRHMIRIANAGNPGVTLAARSETGVTYSTFADGGMCLGLLDRNDLYERAEFNFNNNDRLFVFSDGIHREELVTVLDGSPGIFDSPRTTDAEDIVTRLRGRCSADDDMVLLLIDPSVESTDTRFNAQFASSYDGVNEACEWLERTLGDDGVPGGHDPHMLMLAVREALLNAVEHGNRRAGAEFVDVGLKLHNGTVAVDVSDAGAGFDLQRILDDIEDTPDSSRVGKRGLHVMRSFTDEIEVHGGTVTLMFHEKKRGVQ